MPWNVRRFPSAKANGGPASPDELGVPVEDDL